MGAGLSKKFAYGGTDRNSGRIAHDRPVVSPLRSLYHNQPHLSIGKMHKILGGLQPSYFLPPVPT
jgi:hypothetical protein